ncbi:MAG: hypothetical protein LC745_08985, partial [Planctomycetia bacterium]|nr:hypothetical protein [Planctomycetia bacterium]
MSNTLTEPVAPPESLEQPASPLLISPQGPGPIRSELFGLAHLEAHALRLARACALAPPKMVGSPLLERFSGNEKFLSGLHDRIAGSGVGEGQGLDGEWFADNFHILDEVLLEIRRDLPRGYDRELP